MAEQEPVPPLKAPRLPRYHGDATSAWGTPRAAHLLDEISYLCPSLQRWEIVERAFTTYLNRVLGI